MIKKYIWGIKRKIRLLIHSYEKIFSRPGANCYFIGIGGIGMSSLAFIMKDMGFRVSGSDMAESAITKKLQANGIKVFIGQKKKNISKDINVMVVSSAISKNNPELEKALEYGIPIAKRSFVLGQMMKRKRGVAIAGTHGKTTTTTMISLILKNAKMNPTAMIGGEVKNIGGNFLSGSGEYFIAEACEYDRSFLDLYPEVAIITNIEADHLDCYKDIDDIKNTFKKFVKHIPESGLLIISADDNNCLEVAKEAKCKVVGFGFGSKNRMQGENLDQYWEVEEVQQKEGETVFSLSNGKDLGSFSLHIPGKHNIANACAAIILSDHLKIDMGVVRSFLSEFSGTNRRFQIKGEKNGIVVIDDYSHHPTEIKYALEGAKKFFKTKKILAIFEPHQYSRTHLLKKEFGYSFGNADLVIIPGIYESRDSDEDKKRVSAEDVVDEIKSNGTQALHIDGYDKVVEYMDKNLKKGEWVVLTIGAGSVYKIGEEYLKK
jgi:UDP-N-acetylmuramate--alanine ligase